MIIIHAISVKEFNIHWPGNIYEDQFYCWLVSLLKSNIDYSQRTLSQWQQYPAIAPPRQFRTTYSNQTSGFKKITLDITDASPLKNFNNWTAMTPTASLARTNLR